MWLHNVQGLEGQLARWVEQLAIFQYKTVHRPGKAHANAHALSRLPAFAGNTTEACQTEVATVGQSLQGSSVCCTGGEVQNTGRSGMC